MYLLHVDVYKSIKDFLEEDIFLIVVPVIVGRILNRGW